MADPVVKPAGVAGAKAGQSGAPPKAASPANPPPSAPAAKGASAAGAKGAPKPITSIEDLIESAEDRVIPKGSTVRVSPDNADVANKARQEELEDSLEACGIKVVWDKTIAKDAIVVQLPGK